MPSPPSGSPLRIDAQILREGVGAVWARSCAKGANRARVREVSGTAMTNRTGCELAWGQQFALELRCAKLRLQVDQSTLDLDMEYLRRAGQDQVRRARISRSNRRLQAWAPAGMRGRHDHLRQRQLPRVTQANGRHRVESPSELVSARCRQPASGVEGDVEQPALSLADLGLARACQRCEARLAQTSRHSRNSELPSEEGRKVPGP